VEAEERHVGLYPVRMVGNTDGLDTGRARVLLAVIAFYSRSLGCLGSVALSLLLTACLIVLFLLL
jgi:hypothetical protein